MKLPVAPKSKNTLTKSHLGNLFSHFGFRGCAVLSGAEEERRGASIGSWISVLTSSMSNTANLLTSSNWGALFAGRADGDQREFDLETRVTTSGNRIISEMFHSCALNK